MMRDIRTVIWKEWRSLINGQSRRQLMVMVVMLAFWAVWLPVQTGADLNRSAIRQGGHILHRNLIMTAALLDDLHVEEGILLGRTLA